MCLVNLKWFLRDECEHMWAAAFLCEDARLDWLLSGSDFSRGFQSWASTTNHFMQKTTFFKKELSSSARWQTHQGLYYC